MSQIRYGYLKQISLHYDFYETQRIDICQISQLKFLNPEEYKITIKLMKLAFFITCQIGTATCLKRMYELIYNNMFAIL